MKDNVSKLLSASYRESLERNIEHLLEEKESKEPSAKKQKLDTNAVDLNTIYWQVCVCNALLAAIDEQPITHHHLRLLKHGSDSNYHFLCEVSSLCNTTYCKARNLFLRVTIFVVFKPGTRQPQAGACLIS